ncbi:Virginiamycin A acetyltransferase [compost metagenome]|uniref:acetyltransferase n=1 Tax=Janthinobacterium sp. RT4P48 TaxID=3424188 RepID=UPI000FB27DED
MDISTDLDFAGTSDSHPWAAQFTVLTYAGGGYSLIPLRFFRDWLDLPVEHCHFQIGRCSALGVDSIAKYDGTTQSLRIGRFVSGGSRLRFILNGQHETRTISTYMFTIAGKDLVHPNPPQYGDSIIKNDVWIGDEVMMLGGGIIENGCIIAARSVLPPNFRSEPYGIYAGAPAKLVRFRFSEAVRAALLELAWWDMPLSWIRDNNTAFLQDLTADEPAALATLAQLLASRKQAAAA